MKKRVLPLLLSVLILLTTLYGCAQQQPAVTETAKPQIQEPTVKEEAPAPAEVPAEPAGIGPDMLLLPTMENMGDKFPGSWDNYGLIGRMLIFSRLLRLDAALKPVYGDLAESWTATEDGLHYTFTLHKNVKWHDGKDFSADDVAFSIKTALKAAQVNGTIKGALRCIKGAEEYIADETATAAADIEGLKIADNVLTIDMAKPSSTFLLAMAQFNIFPRHLLEGLDPLTINSSSFYDHPIGTGPYMIKEFVPNDYALLEAFDGYFGEKPIIKQVKMTQMTQVDYAARAMADEIDYFSTNDLATALAAIENPHYEAFYTDIYFVRYFMWNSYGPGGNGEDLFNDIRARRAFVMAIDRQALIDNLMPNQATVINSKVPASFEYANKDVFKLDYNPEMAKKLLDECGFDYSKTVKLAAYYSDQGTADFMDAICAYLAEIGVKAEWHLLTGDITAQLYDVKDYHLVYAGLSAMAPEEAYNVFHSGMLKDLMFQKVYPKGYTKMDAMIEELWSCTDDARRIQILKDLQVIETEEMLWNLPMFALRNIQVVNTARVNLPPELVWSNEWSNYERYLNKWSINAAE